MAAIYSLLNILVFPGVLFLSVFGMVAEYVDRKLCAKLQNRVGPPWFQPLADFIKLAAKQDILPEGADATIFRFMPMLALASTVTALFYIPMWGRSIFPPFEGDVIVVLYLLTVPTLTFFLGGWYSGSVFSLLGAVRTITQLFAYEVPLFLSILAPALLANTWSLSEMAVFYNAHPFYALLNLLGLAVAIVALLGKLEKVPFDTPDAETEIVAGTFTEYGGRLLAMFRMAINIEMVVGATLLAAVFVPFGTGLGIDARTGEQAFWGAAVGFVLYIIKVLALVGVMSLLRSVFARMRIDQMIHFCWKIVAPAAFVQLLIDLIAKGILVR